MNKGRIVISVLLVVAVLVVLIVGINVFAGKNGKDEIVVETFEPEKGVAVSKDIWTGEDKEEVIVVVAFKNDYKELNFEMKRWFDDIMRETENRIFLILVPDNIKPAEIKAEIKKISQNEKQDIQGVILVGHIPTEYFDPSHVHDLFPSHPSDAYYFQFKDPSRECIAKTKYGHHVWDTSDCKDYFEDSANKRICTPKFWIGRITPPIKGKQDIQLLKEYFDCNHLYRIGKISYQKKLLVFEPGILDPGYSFEKFEEGIDLNKIDPKDFHKYLKQYTFYNAREKTLEWKENLIINLVMGDFREEYKPYLYSKEEIIYLAPDKDDKKFSEILDTASLETVFYSGHGNWHSMQAGGDNKAQHSFEVFKKIKPQVMFCVVISCGPGNFTQENYLAGWILFKGNSLFVYAAVSSPGTVYPSIGVFQQLAKGKSFGEAFLQGTSDYLLSCVTRRTTQVFLGDPTLKLRYKFNE